jgi:hypothetical protein
MTWRFTEAFSVSQRVTETSTTQNYPLGTIFRAKDETDGAGEFIYLAGVASTVAGSWVNYNQEGATALLAANAIGPVAIAMSANDATTDYGWYQISGRARGRFCSTALASGAVLYATATAGEVDDAVVSGDVIYNARLVAAKATTATVVNTVAVELARPWMTDRVITV